MAVDHYENFPVASFLLPKEIRQDVVNLYRFARRADDIADEGNAESVIRLAQLKSFRSALHDIAEYGRLQSKDPELQSIFLPLTATITRHRLPISLLDDLLTAFEQDVSVKRYTTNEALDQYCKRSANPIGRLMLHFFQQTDPESMEQSDAICTALQRINFLQDVAIDLEKERIYIPQEDLRRFGVTREQIMQGVVDQNWKDLMAEHVRRCRDLLHFGKPLGRTLHGRVGLEVRMIIEGGLRVLEKLEAVEFDVFNKRPVLKHVDWICMFWRASSNR